MSKEVYVSEVIISHQTRRGTGNDVTSPVRIITQVFTKEGEFIAERDPMPETFALMDLVHYANWCKRASREPSSDSAKKWLIEILTTPSQGGKWEKKDD